MAVYSRQLAKLVIASSTAHETGPGPDSTHLWVIRGLGFQVPAGAILGCTVGAWTTSPLVTDADNSGGSRQRGFFQNVWLVVEPPDTFDIGWVLAPGPSDGGVQVSGYLLPFP